MESADPFGYTTSGSKASGACRRVFLGCVCALLATEGTQCRGVVTP